MRRLILFAALLILIPGAPLLSTEWHDIYSTLGASNEDRVQNTGQTIFPTLLIPVGGEFEGMGQAYTAVARDASFFEANPAASASLEFTELTLVHNNWIADTSIDGAIYTWRYGDLGVGAAGKFLHVPFTQIDATSQQGAGGRYSEGTAGLNISYNLFRSFYFPGVAIGATVKGVYRTVPEAVAPGQSAVGYAADLGLLSRFNLLKFFASRTPNFGIGVAATNFGPSVRGEPLPSEVTAGLAYAPIRPVTLAADFFLPVSLEPDIAPPPFGGSAGVSVQVTPFFSVRSGMLLRWGSSRISAGATIELTDFSVDINYNLDKTTQFVFLDRFSIQARLNFGDEGRGALRDRVDRYYLDAWRASATGNLAETVELSERALELDPTFTPARELLIMTQQTLQLQRDLRSIDLDSLGEALGDAENDADAEENE
ncbi:MAG: UPF0164 family protein [Spirochaetales bacterium]